MLPTSSSLEAMDHGRIVSPKLFHFSWTWLFPILALMTTIWFFWDHWRQEGPTIEVEFHEAPGIQANKTRLFYRGVVAGEVTDVSLNEHLSKAIVTIRLKAFATPLSQAGTIYWIDQPVLSLAKTSGLSSLIQGNSLQARLGEGPRTTHFLGMEKAPLHPLEPPGLILKLTAKEIPYLEEGSPITYRGLPIGGVMRKELLENGDSFLIIAIQKQYMGLIHENSRFWMLPAASLKVGPAGAQVEIENLKSMFLGTVAVDTFETPSQEAKSGASFSLAANEQEARSGREGVRFQLCAAEIPTLYVGSPILYRGITVGSVEKKDLDEQGRPRLSIFIEQAFANTIHQKSVFWRLPATQVQAGPGVITMQIASLQTLLQGGIAYDCFDAPAGDPLAEPGRTFTLFSNEQVARLSPEPLKISLEEGQGLLAGKTQVRYLGLPIGLVEEIRILHHHVEITAYLAPGYDFLRAPSTSYSVVRPKLGFDGLSGIETLVSGVYIDCSRPKKPAKPLLHVLERLWSRVLPKREK